MEPQGDAPRGFFILYDTAPTKIMKETDPYGDSAPRWWHYNEDDATWEPRTHFNKAHSSLLNREPDMQDDMINTIYKHLFDEVADKALLEK